MGDRTAPGTAPWRHAEPVMGTVVSFALRHRRTPELRTALGKAVALLHEVDREFSPFMPDSAVSRLRRGESGRADTTPAVRRVLELCDLAHSRTRGAFDAWADGRPDPCGLVKGWAAERAWRVLREAGATDACVNAGGDVRVGGAPGPAGTWCIGVADPRVSGRLLAVVAGRDLAVATSGTTERGAHIIDPRTRTPATGLLGATVTGPELLWADVYATAAMVLGAREAHRWITALPGYALLTVAADGEVRASSDFPFAPLG
ncbi:FAD:protein FMN transferase [Streptomyces nymphaeiformis]|uniref:FAD:protein FMN transferase n=1 Tax=Streptomyces nymphaeiformis TaxID=2663842 RepID=A0A7W7U3D8_9ACTN|nr:FAD:protein FMN transferase [Streptomyces nymphaeiformis]MBB4984295.1 thiamine biosynthesis lipoprotein [Streptomyces nymphaeiformis]